MINLENLLLIDIETVPLCQGYAQLPPKLQQHWDKKASLIQYEEDNSVQAFSERAGVYAEFGKIICIGLGYFIREENAWSLKTKVLTGDDEVAILHEFAAICRSFFKTPNKQFCGHNIREFDMPYICRRSLINGIQLPPVLLDLQNKRPWENPMLDTMQLWKFGEYKNFTSVDLLAAILKIESPKEDIDGSDVAHVYWNDHDLPRIATYCQKDIVTVAQILMRLNGLELIPAEKINFIPISRENLSA